MNLFTGESSDEYFGSDTPPSVRRLLEQAAGAPPQQIEALLWTAQASAPECLATYYLLYKFHAGRRQFALAERAARKGLHMAAEQAGLDADWTRVQPGAADFSQIGPARFWLFTLKALAFISLRSGREADARAFLAHVQLLDPQGGVGGEVIAALAAAASGGSDKAA
ncbi:hypothetical protein [Derxia gummosa]|uniref:Uncharacterized protein n=1 Tax=Derxia gummosa DSM 723 TaxID=1121388 RepID=A0A8B6X1Q5_9BURK|nr:hypothetical protein [Derxia gummosa]